MPSRGRQEATETIAALAHRSFKEHVLTRRQDGGWRCGATDTNCYAFSIVTIPGVVFMAGDLGEFVWCHADHNSLAWYLYASSRDYFLEKLRACGDGGKREFMYGDAMAHLAERAKDVRESYDGERRATGLERISKIRRAMAAVRDDNPATQQHTWWEACSDNGDSDPAECLGWKSGPLWAWEAALAFRRLHAALPGIDTDNGQRLLIAANGPQPAIEVARG